MKNILFLFILSIIIITSGCTKAVSVGDPANNSKNVIVQADKIEKPITSKCDLKDTIVSETNYDIDKDGKDESIQIILENGEFIDDKELWSGNGQKWVGAFTLSVLKNGAILYSQSLNKLMYPIADDSFFLYAPEFKLELNDYNDDGLIDFNIGQYFSSNGFEYKFFTVSEDGIVCELPFENRQSLFISARGNSIKLKFRKGIIEIPYYDNANGGSYLDVYKWNNEKKIFELVSHVKKEN